VQFGLGSLRELPRREDLLVEVPTGVGGSEGTGPEGAETDVARPGVALPE